MKKRRIGIIENLNYTECLSPSKIFSASELMSISGGNTGNIAYVQGIRSLLSNEIRSINWSSDIGQINKDIDHIIVCCANQLGSHVDLSGWADRLQNFNKPVTLIGLGVQSNSYDEFPELPSGTKKFLDIVNTLRIDSTDNISVRGQFTKTYLESLGYKSVVTGCPSMHINPDPDLGNTILKNAQESMKRVAVLAGNPWDTKSCFLEKKLIQIVLEFSGSYVLQHPIGPFQLMLNEFDSIDIEQMKYFYKVYGERIDDKPIFTWFKDNAVFYTNPFEWLEFYKNYTCSLGPRYHGVALSLQSGVQGFVITIDSRTKELCDETCVPYLEIDNLRNLTSKEIVESCVWSNEIATKYSEKKMMNRIVFNDFLLSQSLYPNYF
jgi:hypothetical protein